MIGLFSRFTIHGLALCALVTGLAAANAARAEQAAVSNCRVEDQNTEMVSDCDSTMHEVKLEPPAPPVVPPPTSDPIYLIVSGEGDKHDHDRDPGNDGGSRGRDAAGRPR
jgi:hypothetical protein